MMLPVVSSILAGALLWLDRVFIFQSMVSRPIILSPILGLILGNVTIGFLIGASLELLWLNAPPVGAYLPNDESFCAAAATPTAVLASAHMSDAAAAGFALAASLPFAVVGRTLDTHIRMLNQDLIHRIPEGRMEPALRNAIGKALLRSYLYALAALGISVGLLCTAVILVGEILPDAVKTALSYMPLAGVVIGLAGLMTKEVPRPVQAGLFILGIVIILMISWIP
ncbi:MAG: PTS sugar transporter subunit IIC [Desulfomonilia bacterium]|jgi:mannose/fructose/N-acetylgalactosamine-specific phosphotransferase system component IIC|uniref:PTS system sorbose-specific iic component n=1 Tax=anaerobic digester metagenome TaxID=1263854 RepID=A0A485M4T5_9ZZZZ|nr:PTS sugar transporter subunit IIC [Pseudomonadota bacterium]HON38410.1 PTS sugar transporter subunit IIC [Deltaproteobacteria bacterium]HPD21601.1 PTS sugar transporter subunit IIC [Deltaproteobacteria bacterium]HRS56447.1 PTS sugar transporter subunit IIC [Desulfomonilia bacterium]HRV36235.1 PTS sugar transporter subunit IIC [Desulfomonilia bacterium]